MLPPCLLPLVTSLGLSGISPKAPALLHTCLIQAKGPEPLTRGIWAALFFPSSRSCASPAEKPGASSEDYESVPDLHYFSLSSEIATGLSLILLLAPSFILNCNYTRLQKNISRQGSVQFSSSYIPRTPVLLLQPWWGYNFGSDFHKTQVAPLKNKPSQ